MNSPVLVIAASVSHTDASDYLLSRQWSRSDSRRGYAAIYRSPGTPQARQEVHVPLERDLGDYAEAMLEVARGIARYESRETTAVLRDLTRARIDTLRIALTGMRMATGTVRLDEGVALVSGAKKALMASACSVRNRRKYHPRMSISEAEAFVRECRLGQTEVGSFVLTVEAPINTVDQPQEQFGREASAGLLKATSQLASAIRSRSTARILDDEKPIISANLCSALLEMMPSDEGSDLRLAGSWSPIVAPPLDTPSEVTFDREMFEEVETLGLKLRSTQAPVRDMFFGFVVELSVEQMSPGPQGDVVLRIAVDDELINAKLSLAPAEFKRAGEALLGQSVVSVSGLLHRGRRNHRLEDPRDFQVHER